jgi:hypothetical protein
MSYMCDYSANGFMITFSDSGIILNPATMKLDNPNYIEALRIAQLAYDEINNVHSIGEYMHEVDFTPYDDEAIDDLIKACDRADAQTYIHIPAYIQSTIERIRAEADYRNGYKHRPVKPAAAKSPVSPKPGFVYLVRAESGHYKIGRTRDPQNRIKTFSVQLPFRVEFEHVIKSDDMCALEEQLHERYANKRLDGEWFNLSADDVDYIKSLGGES